MVLNLERNSLPLFTEQVQVVNFDDQAMPGAMPRVLVTSSEHRCRSQAVLHRPETWSQPTARQLVKTSWGRAPKTNLRAPRCALASGECLLFCSCNAFLVESQVRSPDVGGFQILPGSASSDGAHRKNNNNARLLAGVENTLASVHSKGVAMQRLSAHLNETKRWPKSTSEPCNSM